MEAGDYEVRCTGSRQGLLDQWYDGVSVRDGATMVTVVPPAESAAIDCVMTTGGAISGTVTDVTAAPIAGIPVEDVRTLAYPRHRYCRAVIDSLIDEGYIGARNGEPYSFSKYIYGSLNDTLEGTVVGLLKDNNMIISTAESCTGGMLASPITNVSGSSSVFKESIITYSNEAKIKYLDVSLDTINKYGAVSLETAFEMANNLFNKTDANITISITGVAGPTGGTKENPIGFVCFGINFNGVTKTYKRMFNGDRFMIKKRTTIYALNLIRKELIKIM